MALSTNEDFVVVAEPGARTVVRRWLTGDRAGMRDLLCQNCRLPGRHRPWQRRGRPGWTSAAPRLPRRAPQEVFDDHGTLVHDQDMRAAGHGAKYHVVTEVREHEGRVWMGSLHEPAVAVYRL